MRSPAFLLAVVLAAPVAAQSGSESTWTLTDARGGFCIWYLADPELARELVPKETMLRAAGPSGEALPAPIARVIQDEPRFASWIPATICIGLYGSASVDGKATVAAKDNESVMVLTHSMAASDPRGVPGADHFLLELATDRGSLARAAEINGVRTFDREVQVVQSPDAPEDQEYVIKIGKTRIIWQGHPTGDARVEWTRSMSFGYAGQRLSTWMVTFEAAPQQVRSMVGALRVEGKDDLGKVLKASPIRAVGPIERGGSASITFSRAGGR